jgi:hypothetical protein
MIFLVNVLDRYRNPLSEVLLSAPSRRELRFRLADLVDCVEAIEEEDGSWELKGLDIPYMDGETPAGKEYLDYCEEACLYAIAKELSVEELEEYLQNGKKQEEYLSILKCHLELRDRND